MRAYHLFRILLIGLPLLLSACVTTSTGGFNVEVSDEKALQNFLMLSENYLQKGDLANAKSRLNRALAIDPRNSDAHGIWGLVYQQEGEAELAEDSFSKALRYQRGNSKVRNNYAAFLYVNQRYQEAYEQLEMVVADTEYPARSKAFENLGFSALRLNRIDDAEYAFSRALQLNGNQVLSALELADIYLKKGDIEQARVFYQNFLTTSQFYRRPPTARGLWVGYQLETLLKNVAAAEQYAAQLQRLYPQSVEYEFFKQSQP